MTHNHRSDDPLLIPEFLCRICHPERNIRQPKRRAETEEDAEDLPDWMVGSSGIK